jgi:3-hydroxyisobutyrate dehydrogenase-like beta-hydroxyacid dehydrogenase
VIRKECWRDLGLLAGRIARAPGALCAPCCSNLPRRGAPRAGALGDFGFALAHLMRRSLKIIATIAPGAMGSAVARRLHENGLQVLTSLNGRSAESVKRAQAAGMTDVPRAELARADIFLSIVPPGAAISLAEETARDFAGSAHKPLYVDCNAINPQTAQRVAAIVEHGGIRYADAGIIGGPPKRGYAGPIFYFSGEHAAETAALRDFGLDCRVLDSGPFAASALKMSYAGITKGLTALASVMAIGASEADVADALRTELAQSQPMLLAWFERQIPSMFSKAYRWVAEMEEIAGFLNSQPEAERMFHAIAEFYAHIAAQTGKRDVEILTRLFDQAK